MVKKAKKKKSTRRKTPTLNGVRRRIPRLWKMAGKMKKLKETPEEEARIKEFLTEERIKFEESLERQREIHQAVRELFFAECDKAKRLGRSKLDIRRVLTSVDRVRGAFEALNIGAASQFHDRVGETCFAWEEMKRKPLKK